MKTSQEQTFKWIFIDEGGYTDHPDDDGGPTNKGITLAELKSWRKRDTTKADLKELTSDEAKSIYTAWYWDPLRCSELPVGVDYMVFDTGLLHGITRASQWLQVATNVTSDGKLGPVTMAAVAAAKPLSVVLAITELRRRRIKSHPDRKHFGAGWTNRITRVHARALKLLGVE